jgi:hypothetical protein
MCGINDEHDIMGPAASERSRRQTFVKLLLVLKKLLVTTGHSIQSFFSQTWWEKP